MRIFNKYAYMGAIALVGAVGFTACSSDDDLTAPQNPTFDGESVKTQFAINIPYAGGKDTRMSDEIVQGQTSPVFRGMTNIRLVPFDLETTPTDASKPVETGTTLTYNGITLGDIAAATDYGVTTGLTQTGNAHVYKDVDIRVGVNAFLLYGEAKETSADNKVNGALNPSYEVSNIVEGESVDKITFSLQPIVDQVDPAPGNALVVMLNDIASAKGTTGSKTDWYKTDSGTDLNNYFKSFITLKAGSANSIRLALQDLYTAMSSPAVDDIDGLKAEIIKKITQYFDASGSDGNYTLTYNSTSSVKDYKEYPSDKNLPDGAVQVEWTDGTSGAIGSFSYKTTGIYYPGSTSDPNLNMAALTDYTYPASLYYWTNSSIKTSESEQSTNYGTKDWSTILASYYTDKREVVPATQSIALEQTINYGVARLDINAAFASTPIQDKDNEYVTLPTEGFQLVGVLVGGQKQVGWDFATNASAAEQTIYDAAVKTSTYVNRTSALKNRTLVLETYGKAAASTSSEKVQFALEFVNNGNEAFTGIDGIVPVGGKFYLVGQLETDASHDKVFEQDHYTTATVTINSLKNAYNCIPDLRSPKLELGVSVDLTWIEGLSDDVIIL